MRSRAAIAALRWRAITSRRIPARFTPCWRTRLDGSTSGQKSQAQTRRKVRLFVRRALRRWLLLLPQSRRYPCGMDAPVILPTVADVDEAARRLAGVALHTPLLSSAALDDMTGGRVFLKAETLQRTGSFKFRGAYNKLAALPPEQRAGGLVAFS